jgi:hypothetical protein
LATTNHDKPLGADAISGILKRATELATGQALGARSWRVTTATRMLDNGDPVSHVMASGGWSTDGTLLSTYNQHSPTLAASSQSALFTTRKRVADAAELSMPRPKSGPSSASARRVQPSAPVHPPPASVSSGSSSSSSSSSSSLHSGAHRRGGGSSTGDWRPTSAAARPIPDEPHGRTAAAPSSRPAPAISHFANDDFFPEDDSVDLSADSDFDFDFDGMEEPAH